MGQYVELFWKPSDAFGYSRKDRAGGKYRAYIPDRLSTAEPEVGSVAFSRIADAQSAVARADAIVGESGLYLNHLLLRSESIASSKIEGYFVSPKKLALTDVLSHGSRTAQEVIHNLRATEFAINNLALKWDFAIDDLIHLQQTIAPHLPPGIRVEQNWIGGTGNTPLNASFVPPPEYEVEPLLHDLLEYVNKSEHPPLLKAAIAHAQFETIHPFVDGNGRTGRALIHAILKRDQITTNALLPISAVFANSTDEYIQGLTAFRKSKAGVDEWLSGFATASVSAAQTVVDLKRRTTQVDEALVRQHAEYRNAKGLPARPREGSTVSKLLTVLASAPVLTISSTSESLGVSTTAAEAALNELANAGVLSRNKNHRGAIAAFVSDEHLNLVNLTERRVLAGGSDTARRKPQHAPPLPDAGARRDSDGRL